MGKLFLPLQVVISTVVICWITQLNGFPLVYYDSAYYLQLSKHFNDESIMIYRPLLYSLLMMMSWSVFVLIFIQNLWLNTLIFKTAQILELPVRWHLFVISLASFLTPLAIYGNFLLPDIFIAIQFLAFFCFLKSTRSRAWTMFYIVSLILASMAHYSNFILAMGIGTFYLFRLKKKAIALFLPLILLPLLHLSFWKKPIVTDSAYFFIFSRLSAFNITDDFFKENCGTRPYKLCIVKDRGFNPWDIGPNSVIVQAGGLSQIAPEMKEITLEIFKTPRYVFRFVIGSLKNWGRQFFMFSTPLEDATHDEVTEKVFQAYSNSTLFHQQKLKTLDGKENTYRFLSRLFWAVIFLSVVVLIWMFRRLSLDQKLFFKFLMAALVLNSLICGVLTEPMDRYQGRIIFLVPLFVFYLLFDRISSSDTA